MRGDEEHISIGHAKTTGEPGQLRVSFFWKFYSDYNIMAVGEKGEWMLIGSSSPKYLWILSRTPTLPQRQLEYIIALAAQRGYNVNKLIFVKQD
jgi:lipocalin